jgi:hypothetical protein
VPHRGAMVGRFTNNVLRKNKTGVGVARGQPAIDATPLDVKQ